MSSTNRSKQIDEAKCHSGKTNNNDDSYHSSYVVERSSGDNMSGRTSRESAFSSDGPYDDSSNSESHSGRSSANQETPDNSKKSLIKITRYIAPEVGEARELVDKVRKRFLELYQDSADQFDRADLEEFNKPLPAISEHEQSLTFRLISRYINFNSALNKGFSDEDIDNVCKRLEDLLTYRKHYNVSYNSVEDFPKEFHQLNGLFQFGRDLNNLPVVYMRARIHRRWSPKLDDLFRKYVAWQINMVTKSFKDAKVTKSIDRDGRAKDGSFGICFDCAGIGYSCVDLDFMRFLVKLLVDYYPTYCQYALCIDLPWLFRSIWKLVRSWLPEEAQNNVHLITSKELIEFIPEDQIPNSIPYKDWKAEEKPARLKHQYPANYNSLKTIEDFSGECNISASELKQFKNLVEKICKDYKQLGAI